MSIQIQGLEAVQTTLNNLSKTLSKTEMKNTMATIGGMVRNEIEESFEEERSPWGEKWKPLKTVSYHLGYSISKGKKTHTKKGKQSVGFGKYIGGKKLLRESGNLADRWSVRADNSSVEVSGNAKSKKGFVYGAVHQWGSTKVAARKFLPIDERGELEPRLQGRIENYLNTKVDEALK